MTKEEREQPHLAASGVANAAVIDMMAHDKVADEVLLVMREPREWIGGDEQLHELQEKFNAYASFLLDGEFAEAHPQLVGRKARIELHCDHMPDDRAIELLKAIHDQLAFQDVKMEVIVAETGGGCGGGCTCH